MYCVHDFELIGGGGVVVVEGVVVVGGVGVLSSSTRLKTPESV